MVKVTIVEDKTRLLLLNIDSSNTEVISPHVGDIILVPNSPFLQKSRVLRREYEILESSVGLVVYVEKVED